MTSSVFQKVFKATHSSDGSCDNKSHVHVYHSSFSVHETPHHERQFSTQTDGSRFNPKRDRLFQQYRKVRRWAKILSSISTLISVIFSVIIESIMIYVLYKFYSTSRLHMEGRPWGPWAKESVIWPTFMFAAISLITSMVAMATLIALCYRSKSKAVNFSLAYVALHVFSWIIVAIVYRVEKTEKDLWGWSCSDKAKVVQQQLGGGKVDFNGLCNIQGASWGISIAHAVVKTVAGAVSWYFDREQGGLRTRLTADVGSSMFDQLTG
ncbi:hypothetical protein H2200_008485 [Cladophialophora chaetospira]|uniref:MARVEL domain-containing protein n=1 Tax=Cladophialophora chaetospira TaxID=386627 RepID=A0AA38X616_9EURO|nr:hypothetical protein H2200_008485 [Cladophialophora chaetospira]